ncbi:hypothetical protein GP2143_03273 [marine gamma proteobacterium HTCC2143]|uniref:Uncharacterized protein n=1 Tax=marine gamma proteobacterium HTCC2143 TaxID=247633 RepID=A0YD06_9GAMM|nr:hypothetical protein GP2143_03273 [marine gamma proteobacterium HTCC2143]
MDNRKIIIIAKLAMYLSATILLLFISFLAYNSSNINYKLASEVAMNEIAAQKIESSKINYRNTMLKGWRWFFSSDVGVSSEKYPIIILRSGFKGIKISDTPSLVVWKIDIFKTSVESRYLQDFTCSITDSDGFDIVSSSASGNISAQSFGAVQGTLKISNYDLERLPGDDWTISIGS